MMYKIMVVEDDVDISSMLNTYLVNEGYEVCQEYDGVSAIDSFDRVRPDMVLLDVMIPGIDGYGVCKVIRKKSDVPVMMITALDSEESQLKGYECRIDDYVTKPFSMPVLLQKVAALLRRYNKVSPETMIKYRDIEMNLEEYTVKVNDLLVELTKREFEMLKTFLNNQGKVMTRSMLMEMIWNYDMAVDDRIVDTHIKNLRKKLGCDYIETVRGVGYRVAKCKE